MSITITHPPFDPELAAVLASLPVGTNEPLRIENIPAGRETLAAMLGVSDEMLRRGGAITVEERQIPGPVGAPDISVMILRPANRTGAAPALYNIHGGGMIMGNSRTGLEGCLDWIEELGIVVVSVEYRLAPEHPHPAPVEDCYAGLVWTAEHAEELGIDPARLAIIGGSAGGGLAAGTALLARDRGGPALTHQILMCPMLDDRCVTPSSQELDREGIWDRADNLVGWTALLGADRGGPDVSPYAAPARATDLTGLPATFIDIGSVETFRDEAIDYAARLSQAAVPVDLHMWAGGFHGFDGFAPQAAVSQAARAARLSYLRRALS
jgi:acetyl esterase/lipase